jgi:hypothetical protein
MDLDVQLARRFDPPVLRDRRCRHCESGRQLAQGEQLDRGSVVDRRSPAVRTDSTSSEESGAVVVRGSEQLVDVFSESPDDVWS